MGNLDGVLRRIVEVAEGLADRWPGRRKAPTTPTPPLKRRENAEAARSEEEGSRTPQSPPLQRRGLGVVEAWRKASAKRCSKPHKPLRPPAAPRGSMPKC
jgi:hypothetical protein